MSRTGDPFDQIRQELDGLKNQIKGLSQAPLRLPVVDADPDSAQNGNVWLMEDGRLRVRNAAGTVKEYAPVGSPGGTTTTVPKPAPPPAKKTYVSTWAATWTQAYKENGSQRTDTNHLYYGYADSFNGRQKSLIGFNWSAIKTQLTGASISKVEIYFHQIHAWWNWGAYVRFGIHNNNGQPGTYGGVVRNNVSQVTYGKPQAKWATIATEVGVRFRDGTGRGILIDQLSSDRAFYGAAAGLSDSGSPPYLRFTYVK